MINEQLKMIITDRNIKEETLKNELHSVKVQLNSTIGHNKSMREEVATLKKNFKQKENKYLEEFLDMKALKEKVKDKLFKQDQSLQIVHMLCKPKPYYEEIRIKGSNRLQNPYISTRAMQFSLLSYMGHEIHQGTNLPRCVMNNVNTVSRFSKMHDAYIVERACCLDLEAEISKLKHKILKDDHSEMIKQKVIALQEQIKLFRAENAKIKQHYKELYDSIKITRAKTIEKTTSLLTENEKLKAQLKGKMKCVTMDTMKPKVLAPGVNCFTEASGSKPRSNIKNNRILPAKSDNKKKVEAQPRNNKSNLKQKNRVDYSISSKRAVINSNSKSVCKTCNKCFISANHDMCVVEYLNSVNAPHLLKML
ncbi:hypothetical protein Tco_0934631 [Tanacetum coccineum]